MGAGRQAGLGASFPAEGRKGATNRVSVPLGLGGTRSHTTSLFGRCGLLSPVRGLGGFCAGLASDLPPFVYFSVQFLSSIGNSVLF